MEDINLHFTGDFHAITTAHNLLVGADRQPHLLGQRARHRHPPRRLAARDGHERPGAARRSSPRSAASPTASRARPASTSPSPPRSWRSSASPRTSRTSSERLGNIIVGYTPRQDAGHAPRPQGRRRDDRAAQGRACSRTWCRRWRTTRPSSTAARSPTSPMAATRWSPPGRRCKLADYVVTEAGFGADLGAEKFFDIKCRKAGLEAGRRRDRRHRARAEDARRRRQGGPRQGERRGRRRRAAPTSAATSRTCASSACRRWSPSTTSSPTPTPRSQAMKELRAREHGRRGDPLHALGRGRQGTEELAQQGRRPRRERQARSSRRSIPTSMPLCDKIKTIATEHLPRRGRRSPTRRSATSFDELRGGGLRQAAGLHGQDAVFLLDRSRTCAARRPATSCRSARCGSRPAPGSSSSICGEIMTMPGLPRLPRPKSSASTRRARSRGCSEKGE